MANFLLVHGGFHGSWCWKEVTTYLRNLGHEVFTPTLTGLGERAHLINPTITLETHVQDITEVIKCEELENIILVGHSYAGMVIRSVADLLPNKIAKLVYLDAIVPRQGQSMSKLLGPLGEQINILVASEGYGWLLSPKAFLADPYFFGVFDELKHNWLASKLTPHPANTFLQAAQMSNPLAEKIPVSYIYCTEKTSNDVLNNFSEYAKSRGWNHYELATGHNAMTTAPTELAQMLISIAKL